jgi:hypothetical protein
LTHERKPPALRAGGVFILGTAEEFDSSPPSTKGLMNIEAGVS